MGGLNASSTRRTDRGAVQPGETKTYKSALHFYNVACRATAGAVALEETFA